MIDEIGRELLQAMSPLRENEVLFLYRREQDVTGRQASRHYWQTPANKLSAYERGTLPVPKRIAAQLEKRLLDERIDLSKFAWRGLGTVARRRLGRLQRQVAVDLKCATTTVVRAERNWRDTRAAIILYFYLWQLAPRRRC